MFKICSKIITSIYFIVFCIGLISCDVNNIRIYETNEIIEVNSQNVTVEEQTTVKRLSPDTINYNQYLKKIWVVKEWDGGAYNYSFSFIITKIEGGIIQGKFSTGEVAEPDFYFYRLDPQLGELSGIINNGVAECQFSEHENKGNIKLIFKGKNEIEAIAIYTHKDGIYKNFILDAEYLFRPYNLTDIKHFTIVKEHSFLVDLNSWGKVNFISGEVNTGDKIHPVAYLTNDQDDILYNFAGYFHVGSKIIKVIIEDINNDGLKDVMITTAFEDPKIQHIEWVFLQMKNGWFYDDELNHKRLN